MMHSGTCPECNREFLGPITCADDVKWSIGSSVLADPQYACENIKKICESGADMMRMVSLNLELKSITEASFSNGWFTEMSRLRMAEIVEEIGRVQSGTRSSLDSRNSSMMFEVGDDDDKPPREEKTLNPFV